MRLLHVVPSYLPATRYGGPIRSVHGLCKAFVERGHDVHVFTTNVDGPGVSPVKTGEAVDLDGVKVWYFGTGIGRRLYRSPGMAAALARDVASFDLIHLHSVFLWPTMAAARSARRATVPYVLSPRGMLVADLIERKSGLAKSAWIALFERANIAGAASIHVTADIEAGELRRLGFAPRRIDVVPNGVDAPEAETEVTYRPAPARPRVLSLGRISWKKGLDRLVSAMRLVPEAELVIAGNDEEGLTPRLKQLATEVGVLGRTKFIGAVDDEAKWVQFRACDVFVMPSLSENFGISALEAMACGRPVVVSNEVGLADAIRETGAGIVTRGEPEPLAEAIRSVLQNDELRRSLGAAGRRAAAARFSWAAIAERMEKVYCECLR